MLVYRVLRRINSNGWLRKQYCLNILAFFFFGSRFQELYDVSVVAGDNKLTNKRKL